MAVSKPEVLWPLDYIEVTGPWGNSPVYYAQFGQRGHNGIDLVAPLGTPVYAAHEGVVLMEGWNIPWSGAAGGIAIILQHWWGYSGYAHLNQTIVNAGQSVASGELIGYSGMTGVGTGAHLHFETFPPNINWANGYSGRVNPGALVTLVPRADTKPKLGGLPMFATYWTGPAVNSTHISGRLVTDYGSFWVPTPQIMILLTRRHDAALLPGDNNDNMLDAEHDIINSFLRQCFVSAQTGVQLDAAKLRSALTDALKATGTNIVVDVDTEVPIEKLAAAFEKATPRIVDAMMKQAGQALSR